MDWTALGDETVDSAAPLSGDRHHQSPGERDGGRALPRRPAPRGDGAHDVRRSNMLRASEKRNVIPPRGRRHRLSDAGRRRAGRDRGLGAPRHRRRARRRRGDRAPRSGRTCRRPTRNSTRPWPAPSWRAQPDVVVAPQILTGFTDNWTFRDLRPGRIRLEPAPRGRMAWAASTATTSGRRGRPARRRSPLHRDAPRRRGLSRADPPHPPGHRARRADHPRPDQGAGRVRAPGPRGARDPRGPAPPRLRAPALLRDAHLLARANAGGLRPLLLHLLDVPGAARLSTSRTSSSCPRSAGEARAGRC